MTRINLRLAQDLKDRVEEAARAAGLSVNAWLVRSATAALAGGDTSAGWASRAAARQRPLHRLGPLLASSPTDHPTFHHHQNQHGGEPSCPHSPPPQPITASIELAVGDALIAASDRGDTVVEVRPSNPDNDVDVRAAAETRVEFSPTSGLLVVRGPKQRGLGRMARTASIDITVELPTGSQIEGRPPWRASGCTAGSVPAG